MVTQVPRHKVFTSFHNDDMAYKDKFVRMLGGDIVDKSVNVDDIDDSTPIKVETIRRKIRDDYIADASATVVLIGPDTWRRKHVDWEIGSSISKTKKNSRCGLLGILLPNHPDYHNPTYDSGNIPPRLADNCEGEDPYAEIYRWEDLKKPGVKAKIRRWIDEAFKRKDGAPPDNGREAFRNNRSPEATQESKFRGQVANPVAPEVLRVSTQGAAIPDAVPRGPVRVFIPNDGVELEYDVRARKFVGQARRVDRSLRPADLRVEYGEHVVAKPHKVRLGNALIRIDKKGQVSVEDAPPKKRGSGSKIGPDRIVTRMPRLSKPPKM